MSKTTQLTPEEWKQLCLLNIVQLKGFLDQIAIPTDEQMKLIDEHMARWRMFMNAWVLAKPEEKPQEPARGPEMNGVEPPKKRRGRPPKVRPEQEMPN